MSVRLHDTPEETVQDILAAVVDITPVIASQGDMQDATDSLRKIKDNLLYLDASLRRHSAETEKSQAIGKELMSSARNNVLSVYDALFETIGNKIQTDDDLQNVRWVAEAYIRAHGEYLRYKEAYDG